MHFIDVQCFSFLLIALMILFCLFCVYYSDPWNNTTTFSFNFQTNSLTFHDKSWTSASHMDLKTANTRSRSQFVVCVSVQEVIKPKVAVQPLTLEDVKEPPLHLYKNKEPYTGTIVSVERLVGPNSPGETCHVVIDHDGNVPFWEGQSYGVIPPVYLKTLLLHVYHILLTKACLA